ncbi:MAG: lysophospholipid acyltransferase family protein [Chitinophagaceae bacterium]|nr:lysophospholipid acyltransferase family protein [Chitinophagaceae bacterium]
MYYILYALLFTISLLPLRVLYFLSDGMYALIYYIIGYRKKVVMHNLNITFPEKSEKEKIRIAKNFYHKFIDSMIETIKLLSASDAFFEKRFTGDWDMINKYYESGRTVQLHLGHTFNWEWGIMSLSKNVKFPLLIVYMPIANKALNRLFYKIRSQKGAHMLSALNMAKDLMPYRRTNNCLGFVADQNPGYALHHAKWFYFFKKKTPFTIGPAKNAIRNNSIVLFSLIERQKRGYYNMTFELTEENPINTNEIELTKKFITYLEKVISNNPEMYLWTHRRWKHEWKEEYGFEE